MTATAGRRLRPTLWATVATAAALLVLLGLGTWQVDRLFWKRDLLARIDARLSAPAVALEALDRLPPGDLEYRRARATGRFLHDREMHLAARALRGQVGYHVVTPFELADGRVLLVNRGWIPQERRDPATRAEGQVPGTVELEGVLRAPRGQGWLQPDNQPAENIWFWVDPPAMAAAAGVPSVLPVVLEAGPAENPGGLPIGGQTRVKIANDHLQYAITWYSLAVALAVIVLIRRRRRDPT